MLRWHWFHLALLNALLDISSVSLVIASDCRSKSRHFSSHSATVCLH